MNFKLISQEVIKNVGGVENIESAAHCVTRLRLILKDKSLYDQKKLENIQGVKGVFLNSGQLQIVFGSGTVDKVFDSFMKETGMKETSLKEVKENGEGKKSPFKNLLKLVSDIFVPLVPALVGAAMLTGVKAFLTTEGLFGLTGSIADMNSLFAGFASFSGIIGSATFTFLPLFIAYSAVKRFGGNPILGIVLGCILLHPELGNAFDFAQGKLEPEYWKLLGFNIPAVGFQGGVFPAILSAWFLVQVEKVCKKYIPSVISFIFVPSVTILVTGLGLFLVFGPIGNIIGEVLTTIVNTLYIKGGAFGAFVFASLLQPLVITGTHHAIGTIEAALVAQTGFNYIQPLWSVSIIAQGGAAIGMFLLAKKKTKEREIAMSSFIPTLFGVSEPAIFAVNIKNTIIPFVCGTIGAGFAGAFMKIFDVKAIGFGLTGLPGLTIVDPSVLIQFIIGNLIAFILPIVFLVIISRFKKVN